MADSNLRDRIIEQMFDVLPCATREEIAEKLTKAMRREIDCVQVAGALVHLRRERAAYGWTVPHVKRGINADGEDRFFAVLVDEHGDYESYDDGVKLYHMQQGFHATAQHSATMCDNAAAAWLAIAGNVRSRNKRRKLQQHAEDMAYIARKTATLAAEFEEGDEAAA